MANVPKIPESFPGSLNGVSSAVTPEMLNPQQLAWGMNIVSRGGKPHTRPAFKYCCTLPAGLVQLANYFSVQGGMGILMINGYLYRLRIDPNSFEVQTIDLDILNSSNIQKAYGCQTVESFVIQNGVDNAIVYNGSEARRSNPAKFQVPKGKQMAYGNGRLWVAVDDTELEAGDIRGDLGTELLFTEINYLNGGGKFNFPNGITGLSFIPTTGTSDYGALMVFGPNSADSVRADITYREQWASIPGFITTVLRHAGCVSQRSIVEVNQDLLWRDSQGGIRTIRSGISNESGMGNVPISREVSRLTDFDSPQILEFCSAINFDNRMLMTSSPFLNEVGGVSWKDLIVLDYAPVSTMAGKSTPVYDGQWSGLNITHLFQGIFDNTPRAFAVTHNDDGSNTLFEILKETEDERDDLSISCSPTVDSPISSPIVSLIETGKRSFQDASKRKRVDRFDVWLSDIDGPIDMQVFWRTDNSELWRKWDEVQVCGINTDSVNTAIDAVHSWKNLTRMEQPSVKTFSIPGDRGPNGAFGVQTGYEFQFRIVWTGRCKIWKAIAYATGFQDPDYAFRDGIVLQACQTFDVTGNEILYQIPVCAASPDGGPNWGNDVANASCPTGFVGSPVTIAANTIFSQISKGTANAKAVRLANGTLSCLYQYWNTIQIANCTAPLTGSTVTIAAGTYSSTESQDAANAAAYAAAVALLVCTNNIVFWNTQQTWQCCCDNTGSSYGPIYVQPAHTFSSTISVAAANSAAHQHLIDLYGLTCGILD
jgi:hypothetical protein